MKYFRIVDDASHKDRWYLDEPVDENEQIVDARLFSAGKRIGPFGRLRIPLQYSGASLDFTLAAFDMPVVARSIGGLLREKCGDRIQLFPAAVEGSDDAYEILNVSGAVDCIDESSTLIERWEARHGRPDKVGQYRTVAALRVDPVLASGHQILRPQGWPIALVVSDDLRRLLRKQGARGIGFTPV